MDTAMAEPKLKIGYAGTLISYHPGPKPNALWRWVKDWIWTYRFPDIAFETRSGYFLFKGIQRFKEKYPELAGRLEVKLWGLIDPGNNAQVKSMGISDIVSIEGFFNKPESAARILASDVLFLPLETGEDPLFIPGKIFDYLKQGKPVFILGNQSDCTDILIRSGLGFMVDPYNADSIADALQDLVLHRDELPNRHKVDWAYLEENFHFKNLAAQLGKVFEELG